MILYWNEGKRRYGEHPIPVYRRVGWEFQFFVSGSCHLIKGNGSFEEVQEGTLWVFPPTTPHGWGGEPNSECEIRVVHFSRVRGPLGDLVSRKGLVCKHLPTDQLKELETIFQRTGQAYLHHSPFLELHAERLLVELCLLILQDEQGLWKEKEFRKEERIVASAISYYRDHMHEGIGVNDVAKAVSVCPSHLRRLFHRVKRVSPRQWFQEEQLLRAEEMLQETAYTLETIAESCGYDSAASLIRVFRCKRGSTPGKIRRKNSSTPSNQ